MKHLSLNSEECFPRFRTEFGKIKKEIVQPVSGVKLECYISEAATHFIQRI